MLNDSLPKVLSFKHINPERARFVIAVGNKSDTYLIVFEVATRGQLP
jgi:hypothetical protein